MSKHPLAVVCALAFVFGGAAAFVLDYPPRGAAGFQDVAEKSADIGRGVAAETVAAEAQPARGVRPEEITASGGGDSVPRPGDVSVEHSDMSGGEAGQPSGGVSNRGSADGRTVDRSRATRSYAIVSRGGAAGGGRGLAGHTVSGVKKTGAGVKKAGATIGKTFGKIGGVFHD